MAGFLSRLLTLGEGKQLKNYEALAQKVNALEGGMQAKSDAELAALTAAFRERADNGEDLKSLLPEAFAAVREASVRTLGLRHFDVQLIGGMALNDGQIAEMKTGEGKTLVSTLAGYLNALNGTNVHIVTVNDYLARRDSEWMGQIYRFLGMDVGLIQNGMRPDKKIPAYRAEVTYGTNSEFGFDYLRDNMVTRAEARVQRGHHFAIVDEVDSILIDEARTPLIISGAGTQAAETYNKFARVMPGLVPEVDFDMDEAKKTINATEGGLEKIEAMLGIDDIYADPSGQLANHLQQALKAQFLFHRDVDYVVVDGEVKIVDEFTGRIMEGRRWSEGLHQAVEAKERVLVREENQTLATITLQNYFRLYEKLSGMTGTAMTEDAEFREIYKLPVVAIPPNRPVARKDEDDLIYRTVESKFNAVADDVAARNAKGQPCLIGTVSIESSEKLSRLLDKRGIKHETLNAKNHEREAHIIAQAGRVGAVTIATNMAGRGTDILLGGNPDVMAEDALRAQGLDPDRSPEDVAAEGDEAAAPAPTEEQRAAALAEAKRVCAAEHDQVIAAGGLTVIGTERHESRRIDNQLRGRAGRQGDPGTTQFYLSLEDDLMRLFGGNRMDSIGRMMEKTDMPDDMPIQAGMVSKAIESAQRQVESMHFSARKNVLEYDDVMNLQRAAIYGERNAILDGKDLSERIPEIVRDAAEAVVAENCPDKAPSDDWDVRPVETWAANMTGRDDFKVADVDHEDDPGLLADALVGYLDGVYAEKAEQLGEPVMKMLESQVMLRIIDTRWMAHLQEMDYLKSGIGLRAFGQRDPLVEYKNEAYNAFQNLTSSMYEDYLRTLLRLQVAVQQAPQLAEEKSPLDGKVSYSSPEQALEQTGVAAARRQAPAAAPGGQSAPPPKPAAAKPQTFEKDKDDPFANVGRNDPCPCGSGKKFKKCHGANQ
ncbi:preprotein translocase subunit SecA [Gordonibacter urolithinfaciens]|uniref:Protein translocase subunit SecA n=1 Tax=Gordonibacter urolithinfaciens TaxID=1335613 RepID=A0A6N8IGX1_9ACTN|nr:preprotein translocase subunit SecA [Gordonibacter urolithinfaciens]MVM54447.1 preprotein translocase subunit SecA [Gordonibacter urolithinfaciens]MVN15075.1 preprotein translocase subunit SecA [Gordonibacter urolithinfaciens]MVN39890.1 preprotein translocase subunit SecA [Gordonibacter urolithinfaciens]MVN55241.1 preprotein translocase subunit SecA [Gordonibacter urolithinfaciens]MVN60515.1 preprotein translocase subunit SecA [Gordonibacter urolithinfaciens]